MDATGEPRPRSRRAAAKAALRSLTVVVAIAATGVVAGRMLDHRPAVRTHAYGASFPVPSNDGRTCRVAVTPGCAAVAAARVGVTVAWAPVTPPWQSGGLRAGGSAGHGWATQTLGWGATTVTITSSSPETLVGTPVAGAPAGLEARVADHGLRIQLVWDHAGTRYAADAVTDAGARPPAPATIVGLWRTLRYADAVVPWS